MSPSSLMRRTAARVVAGGVALAALTGCSVYELPLPGGADTGDDPMTIQAKFSDVLDLVPQSTVKVDDITVGKVTAIDLDGYVAVVTMEVQRKVDMPEDVEAEIRQTSLLGEKFVSLSEPQEGGGTGKLSDGDIIPLDRSKRNPEVEEVLGAMSLLLNGGGVGQLKIINEELNTALGGRESDVKSLLRQLGSFMGQLDRNKESIVDAIDSLNRLAIQFNRNDESIKLALDELPAALKSIDSQRAALVKMLKALNSLSDVGVRVIKASKQSTINSLRDLAPVLSKLADAQQNLPKSFQVFLTYPFVDEAVGRDPQVARNLHMGDFTNLSVNLDLNVTALPSAPVSLPTDISTVCKPTQEQIRQANEQVQAAIDQVVAGIPNRTLREEVKRRLESKYLPDESDLDCDDIAGSVQRIIRQVVSDAPKILRQELNRLCRRLPNNPLCRGGAPSLPVPSITLPGGLGDAVGGVLPRVGADLDTPTPPVTAGSVDPLNGPRGTAYTLGYNSTLGALLLQGVTR